MVPSALWRGAPMEFARGSVVWTKTPCPDSPSSPDAWAGTIATNTPAATTASRPKSRIGLFMQCLLAKCRFADEADECLFRRGDSALQICHMWRQAEPEAREAGVRIGADATP